MAISSLSNEKDLILKISQGDRRAFTMLFDGYYKSLGSYVYKMTESLEVSEDIVQDVFIKIWLKKEGLTEINSFSNYLFILCKNQTLNYLKKQANYSVRFQSLEERPLKEVGLEQEEDSYEEFRVLIERAIESLPDQQRKIYRLSKFDKLKYHEIASQLNLSVETVKKHMYLASKSVKAHVKYHIDDIVMLIVLTPLLLS